MEPAVLAEVIFPFQPGGPQELALPKGALVEVLKRDAGPWWWGRIRNEAVIIDSEADLLQDDRHGWFPKDFVRIVVAHRSSPMPNATSVVVVNQANCVAPPSSSPADLLLNASRSDHGAGQSSSVSASNSSSTAANSEMMRENVIKELLETEINYVKLLSSLCSG